MKADKLWVDEVDLHFVQKDAYPGRGSCVSLHRLHVDDRLYLYKEYRPELAIDASTLERLVEWRWMLPEQDRVMLDAHCAFPTRVVRRDGLTVGIVMPEADLRFFFTQADSPDKQRPRPLSYLSLPPHRAQDVEHRHYEAPHKMASLGDVLAFILWLHRHDVVIGDLHLENILMTNTTRTGSPQVRDDFLLLDCDSLWLHGKSALPKQEPEIMRCEFGPEDAFTTDTDLFKFALMSTFCLQEDHSHSQVDEAYLRKLMPSDYVDTLIRMMEGRSPSPARLSALARTWQWRMSDDGAMFGSTDEMMAFEWQLGSVQSPRAQQTTHTAGSSSITRPPADAVVTPVSYRLRGWVIAAAVVIALAVATALLVVLLIR
jgi:hypothetical protein